MRIPAARFHEWYIPPRRNQQHNTNRIDTQLYHFIQVLLKIHPETLRTGKYTPHQHEVFSKVCNRLYHIITIMFDTKVVLFSYIIIKDRRIFELRTTEAKIFTTFARLNS